MSPKSKLTKKLVHEFYRQNNLMVLATYGKYPWIATVFYSFDEKLNLYFFSDPATLHCQQIAIHSKVSVAIVDTFQKPADQKKGLQIYGIAKMLKNKSEIQSSLTTWKKYLGVENPDLSYEKMANGLVKGRMYKITPKKIKFFNQEIFKVEDGEEPILVMIQS